MKYTFGIKRKLDEYEEIRRAKAVQHGLYLIVLLLLGKGILLQSEIELVDAKYADFVIVILIITMCSIEMIVKDVFPMELEKQKMLFYPVGVFGIVFLVYAMYERVKYEIQFTRKGVINEYGVILLYGASFFSLFLVYVIKQKMEAKKEEE